MNAPRQKSSNMSMKNSVIVMLLVKEVKCCVEIYTFRGVLVECRLRPRYAVAVQVYRVCGIDLGSIEPDVPLQMALMFEHGCRTFREHGCIVDVIVPHCLAPYSIDLSSALHRLAVSPRYVAALARKYRTIDRASSYP